MASALARKRPPPAPCMLASLWIVTGEPSGESDSSCGASSAKPRRMRSSLSRVTCCPMGFTSNSYPVSPGRMSSPVRILHSSQMAVMFSSALSLVWSSAYTFSSSASAAALATRSSSSLTCSASQAARSAACFAMASLPFTREDAGTTSCAMMTSTMWYQNFSKVTAPPPRFPPEPWSPSVKLCTILCISTWFFSAPERCRASSRASITFGIDPTFTAPFSLKPSKIFLMKSVLPIRRKSRRPFS
mmetsp:Transcript_56028/g.164509  ORF Transcript_56028/g.164509 Transcript_56028/m.164509 type:complete len:245 (-) Transcript_56028:583-1317(-)